MLLGALSGWENISSEDPQKSHLGLVLLSIFIHGWDEGIGGELLKLLSDLRLGELARRLFGVEFKVILI